MYQEWNVRSCLLKLWAILQVNKQNQNQVKNINLKVKKLTVLAIWTAMGEYLSFFFILIINQCKNLILKNIYTKCENKLMYR